MPSDGSDVLNLRESIAHLEALDPVGARSVGAAAQAEAGPVQLGSSLALDAVLGGGLKRGTLHEIVADSARDEAAAAAFALALAVRCAADGALVWILDDRAAGETGTPYRPGLATHGVAADTLVLVRTRDSQTTLWATEEALRAGAPVVITELWRARRYDLAASRRLLLAARRKGATNILVHVGLPAGTAVSSAAETRFVVAARPSIALASAAQRTPIPGMPGFAVRLTKLRGSASGGIRGFDRDEVHPIAWDRQSRCFHAALGGGGRRPQPSSVVAAQPLDGLQDHVA